jgi:hypothetical protein
MYFGYILFFISTLFQGYSFGISQNLYEYVTYTDNSCNRPLPQIANTILLAKEYGIDIIREENAVALREHVYGAYRPTTQDIILYNAPELEYFDKIVETTLKHELIHSIQHCKGERNELIHLLDDVSLGLCMSQNKINVSFITSFYHEGDVLTEIDAYCLEDLVTYADIDLLLEIHCLKYTLLPAAVQHPPS